MTKAEHIKHWLTSSEDDKETMDSLFKDGRYTHCLFFGHLYLEKICKALWIKNNVENTPPYTHNLLRLLASSNITLTEDDETVLGKLNVYQLSGRYPDYTFSLKKLTNKESTLFFLQKINEISACL